MEPTNPQEEVLIARNNETGQVGAVTGLNEDGTPKMSDVKSSKLSDLIKFQKGQNPLEAFMSNFLRQCKNPSTFGFFRVPADRYDSVGTVIADLASDPDKNAEMLKDQVVDPVKVAAEDKKEVRTETDENVSSQTQQTQPEANGQTYSSIDANKVDWDDLSTKWGLDKNSLSDKDISEMLHNRKSKMVTLKPTMFGETFELQARLSFRANPDGTVSLRPHPVHVEPDLSQEFKGHKFSDIDKEMLAKTGNLGRVVELDFNGQKVPSFVSIDRETRELLAYPANIYINPKIGKAELTPRDIGILKSGKQLTKDYPSENGKTYPVVFQFNAAEGKVEFVPRQYRLNGNVRKEQTQDGNNGKAQESQNTGQQGTKNNEPNWLLPDGSIKPIGRWRDYHFNDAEKAAYVAGQTVKANITDKKGQPATVYVKFNHELGRPVPYKKNPDEAQSMTPADESKTQMSVNNDGKNNESTKHVNEPLQKGQVSPKDDTQQKQQRKPKGPKL